MNCSNEKLYALGEKGKPRPPSLNIGSDEEITINALIDMLSEISGKTVKKIYDLSKPQGVRSRSADLTQVKKVLNWQPKYTLKDTMTWLYNWIETEIKALSL